MPPRKRGNAQKNKKCNVIRTRLIELSMKVEDHIYHKKAISAREAELYIKEVTSYQVECSRDERSSQVVEKLLRCMKAIIAEYEENSLHAENIYNENGCSSPVYSLPDEDRTQLSQVPEDQISVNLKYNEGTATISNLNESIQDTHISDVANNDNTLTDIFNYSKETEPNKSSNNINKTTVEIHKALSNLSLKCSDEGEIISNDIECSQSILNNYQHLEQLNITPCTDRRDNTTDNDKNTRREEVENNPYPTIDLTEDVGAATDSSQRNETINIENKSNQANVNERITTVSKKPIQLINSNNTYNFAKPTVLNNYIGNTNGKHDAYLALDRNVANNTNNETCLQDTLVVINKDTKTKDTTLTPNSSFQRYSDKRNTPINNTVSQENTKVIVIKKKRKPKSKIIEGKEVTNTKIIQKLTQINNEKKIIPNKEDIHLKKAKNVMKNDTENKIINLPKRRNNSKKNNNKKASVPIYNKNIENDLSWIEGIRYVREIEENEYDSKLENLSEDFWENYYLPPNFDDADFL